jgi:hypothetical protein
MKTGAIGLLVMAWLLAGCGGDGDSSTTAANLPTITAPNLTTSGQEGAGSEATTATEAASGPSQSSKAVSTTSKAGRPARKLPPAKRREEPQASPAEIRAICQSKASSQPAAKRAEFIADCLNPPPPSSDQPKPGTKP